MGLWNRWRKRIRLLVRKEAVERELDEELAFHIAMETDKNLRAGMSLAEARRQAAIAFGGVERHKEAVRETRVLGWVSGMSLDFTLGLRILVKYPGLTIVGGLAIAFAIWAGATGYEVVRRFAFMKLPYVEAERIVTIEMLDIATNREQRPTIHDFARWRDELTSVDELGAMRTSTRNLIAGGEVELALVAELTAPAFHIPRVAPILGRPLVAEDEQPTAAPVAVVSYGVWQRYFDGDSSIVGQSVRLGRTLHTVVGVMPAGNVFPIGTRLWVPLRLHPVRYPPGEGPAVTVVGRLASGVTLAQAQTEITRLGSPAVTDARSSGPSLRPRVESFARPLLPDLTPAVIVAINLFLVLLVVLVCGNVALLMFARAATREPEIAVRHALGASRRRIIVQLFAEALVLAAVAAAVGLVVADLGARWRYGYLTALGIREGVPFWDRDGIGATTALYAGLLACLAAAIAGVLPALKITRGIGGRLRQAAPGGGGFRFGGFWTAVVVAQIAAMVALPPVAFHLRGEAAAIRAEDHGFAADQFLSVRLEMDRETDLGVPIDVSRAAFVARFGEMYRRLEERLEGDPTVAGVTFADGLSYMRRPSRPIEVEGAPIPAADSASAERRARPSAVAIDYFALMNAPVLLGRAFHAGDTESDARVVIVNRSFVDRILGGRNPIGQRVRYVQPVPRDDAGSSTQPWHVIVGVVRDIGTRPGERRDQSGIYHPVGPGGAIPAEVAVHVREEPERFVARLRTMAAAVDPTLRVHDPVPMDELYNEDLYVMRLVFWLITAVSGGAILLSLAGIHAVLSFTVTQRRREIGIRLALGGEGKRVAVAVVRRPLIQVGLGVFAGAVVTGCTVYMLNEQLSAIGVARVLAYVALMVGVCAAGAIVPARRALRVEPSEAMKVE